MLVPMSWIRVLVFGVFGVITSLAGVGVNTWQFWALLVCMGAVQITTAVECNKRR